MESKEPAVFVPTYKEGVERVLKGNPQLIHGSLTSVLSVRKLCLPLWVLHARLVGAEGLQPHSDWRSGGQQGIWDRHSQGIEMEGQDITGDSPAAGEECHTDAVQQVVAGERCGWLTVLSCPCCGCYQGFCPESYQHWRSLCCPSMRTFNCSSGK